MASTDSTTTAAATTNVCDKSVVERVQALMDVIECNQKSMKAAHLELKQIQKELVKADKDKNAKKAKKDPNAPKRPRTAYIFFCEDQRVAVKAKTPTMSQTELMSKLGEMWKALTEKKKVKFNDMAVKDKARYETAIAEYRSSSSSE